MRHLSTCSSRPLTVALIAYATDPKLTLKYSGQMVDMCYEYPPLLRRIQDDVEHKLGVTFNHVLLNMYEDGTVYIGNHRDNLENRYGLLFLLSVNRHLHTFQG